MLFARSPILKITLGVVVVALFVGGWFGWSAYSSFRDKRKRSSRHEERVNEEELQRQYEQAVMKALRWLKATQEPDGSWGTKPELGLTKEMDKAAGAGFAVLTFLAHGETPASGEFGPTVVKAIYYLINSVYVVKDKNGNEAKDPNGLTPYVKMRGASGSEYGFLIGTYALCEAYALLRATEVAPDVESRSKETTSEINVEVDI